MTGAVPDGESSPGSAVSTPVDEARARRLAELPLVDPAERLGLLGVIKRRYLLQLMVRREINARYMGSKFGLAWSYVNPAVRFATFYFVFGYILGRGLALPNFAIHLFTGMIIVHFFTETFNAGTRSILSNKQIVQKMNVPREMFPIASMLVSLYHTFPQLLILLVACVATGWSPDLVGLGAAGLGLAIVMVFSTGMGLMFAVIGVIFRDFTRIVQTFTNMIQFSVPMMYPYSLVSERFGTNEIVQTLYISNPLAESVLLFQRFFWFPTFSPADIPADSPFDPSEAANFPSYLIERGLVMLGISVVFLVFCQWVFTRLEPRIPELL